MLVSLSNYFSFNVIIRIVRIRRKKIPNKSHTRDLHLKEFILPTDTQPLDESVTSYKISHLFVISDYISG